MSYGITKEVINEIYKKCKKDPETVEELNIPYFIELLADYHKIKHLDDEIIIESFDEMNPFRRFLVRSIKAILEFDKEVAIVCRTHIIFLKKENSEASVHMKPDDGKKKGGFFSRLFGGDDDDEMFDEDF